MKIKNEKMRVFFSFVFSFCLAIAQAQNLDERILTPKPAKYPKVNAVRVFGVRPNNEFMYKIPTTGDSSNNLYCRMLLCF